MNAPLLAAKAALTATSKRHPLNEDRVGCLVQVAVRTEVDDDGNPRAATIQVVRDNLVRALEDDNSPFVKMVPNTKTPHEALAAAITRAKKGMAKLRDGETITHKRLYWRRIGSYSGVLKYGLVVENPDPKTGKLSPRRICVVSADSTGGTNVDWVDGHPADNLERAAVHGVLERYHEERFWLHADKVRSFVNAVLHHCNAINVGGMLHLVPSRDDHDERFRTVERALVSCGYQVLIQPVSDSANISHNAQAGFLVQVARLKREIARQIEEWKAGGDEEVFDAAKFNRRLDEVKQLEARADLFSDLIGDATDDVSNSLEQARRLIRDVQMAALM